MLAPMVIRGVVIVAMASRRCSKSGTCSSDIQLYRRQANVGLNTGNMWLGIIHRYLRGPTSWNAHRKARSNGKNCPAAEDCDLGLFNCPLWQSTATLDEFHRRRRIMEDPSEEGMKASWGILYRQLHDTSELDPLPNPLHDYGSSVQSPSSVAASPPPASPPAYSPVDPFSPSSFANIDETVLLASGMPMDIDVETGASDSTSLTALAEDDTIITNLGNAGSWNGSAGMVGYNQNAYGDSNHPVYPAPRGTTTLGNDGGRAAHTRPAIQREPQVAYNMSSSVTRDLRCEMPSPSNPDSVPYPNPNDPINRPTPEWHILRAQMAHRNPSSPETGTATQHLQSALLLLEER
ncbi:hypothetical protein AC578_9574 [Pseudocercospora eumusae]|uniref:Uncharacterized protein n=1 Tax=Pseudocercospora eumusae TaxID=321146 RepID=A0A139GY06_9PEZI|nr:hypothetical protein AC578_9574 [Pseudocercospora eumusae]